MLAIVAAPPTPPVIVRKPAKLIHYNRLIEKEEYLARLMENKHRRTTSLAKEGKYAEALELDRKLYEEAIKIQRTLNVMWAKYAQQPAKSTKAR